MKAPFVLRTIVTFCIAAVSASCATTKDQLCTEMAAFANSTSDGESRTVRLTTDWGGEFSESVDENEQVMFAKGCAHGSDAPSRALCDYLMNNTSTEFAAINARRAFRCIGVKVPDTDSLDNIPLPPSARSRTVLGRKVRSEISVEFAPATDSAPPALSVTATSGV